MPFDKFYKIDKTDKLHTSLTFLPEAIGLYKSLNRPYMQLDTLSFHYILLVLLYIVTFLRE